MIAILGSSFARAAATAYTNPQGLYAVKIAGTPSGGVPARTYLGAQLLTDTKFVGHVANVNGNAFSLEGVYQMSDLRYLPDPERQCYVHVLTGDGTGFIADIVEFRQTDILCSMDLTPWMSSHTQILIRPHPHLSDLFGTSNRFGLGSGPDADNSDNIVIWDAQTQQERVYYFNSIRNRWEEKGVIADAGKSPVRFPNGLYIVRRSAGTLRIALSGEVGFRSVLLPVRPGANVFALPINLSSSIASLIASDGPFSVIAGPNSNTADLLTLEEAATGTQRGPFYFSSGSGTGVWREIGVDDSGAAIQPLELLSTLILRREGPAGYVLANGSLEPPAFGTLVPVPANPEPGEIPLTAEVTIPSLLRFHPWWDVYVETSTDLATWNRIEYVPPGTTQITYQLPAGESRTFYRVSASF